MTDFEDAIRDRAGVSDKSSLRDYIEQIGSVNTQSEFTGATVYDFFLGDDNTPAFERLNDGEFGGSLVVKGGEVAKGTIRVGQLDIDPAESDVFLVEVRLEELIESLGLPEGFDIDLGDFDQGVPHLRYDPEDHQRLPEAEFGEFMVRAVESIKENFDGLQAIADGDEFGKL